jgi:uncharacterized protein (DUF2236 family)
MPDGHGVGLFADDDVIRRVDGELVLLLGGTRALLMQLAHQLVAKGVAEHSGFEADPFSRLQRTLDASYTIVFGTAEEAHRTARRVHNVHRHVRGEGYEANDPELLLWVHSTLVDTALRIHARFLGALAPAEAETYYAQSMQVAELLGVPVALQPPDLTAFRAYVRHQVGTLRVGDDARRLASSVLHPHVPLDAVTGAPLSLVIRNLTAGLLPAPLRRAYGLSWDPARQAAFAAACLAARQVLPLVPTRLRRAQLQVPAALLGGQAPSPTRTTRQGAASSSRTSSPGRRRPSHRPSPASAHSTTSTP